MTFPMPTPISNSNTPYAPIRHSRTRFLMPSVARRWTLPFNFQRKSASHAVSQYYTPIIISSPDGQQPGRNNILPVPGIPLTHLTGDMVDSMAQGWETYMTEIKHNPVHLFQTLLISGTLGLLYTMFPKNMRLIKLGYLLLMLPFPIKVGMKCLPEMWQANKLFNEGEHHNGEAKFRRALNSFIYEIFIVYTKPLSIAGFLFYSLLSLPAIHRKEKAKNMYELFWRSVMKMLRIPREHPVLNWMDRNITAPLNGIGQKILKSTEHITPLKWLITHFRDAV